METPKDQALAQPASTQVAAAFGEEGVATGFEGTRSTDFQQPFVTILQKMSPQCDPDKETYIPDAKPGRFFQTDSQELFDELDIIPCMYRQAMVEWKPREEGGGFVAEFTPGAEVGMQRDEKGRFVTGRGTHLIDTRYWYCLRKAPAGDSWTPIILALTSTQIKKSKKWLSEMSRAKVQGKKGLFTPPIYTHIYHATTVLEQKDQNTWKGWNLEPVRLLVPGQDDALYLQAQQANKIFAEWAINTHPPEVGSGDAAEPAPF